MNTVHKTLLLILVAVPLSMPAFGADASEAKTRIGTYDSRAIAIAFTPSKFNLVGDKMKELGKAKADGDEKRAKELNQWGQKLQRKLHRQGFSAVPVGDLLKHVEDRLPEVSKSANVIAIVRACDFTAETVEVVDVTDQLVQLFDPSEKTLEHVQGIKGKLPIDLDELERSHQH